MKEKLPKPEVNYRKTTGDKRCGNCSMFIKPSACTLVRGNILAEDVCDRWDKKR